MAISYDKACTILFVTYNPNMCHPSPMLINLMLHQLYSYL